MFEFRQMPNGHVFDGELLLKNDEKLDSKDLYRATMKVVGADGVKLSGVQAAIDTAKKAVTDRLDVIEGKETVKGSIKKALKDAKDYASGYTDTKIASLNERDY